MIKKKSPILLLSVVGTLALCLLAVNLSQYLRNPGGLVEIQAPNKEALEKVRQRSSQQGSVGGASLKTMKSMSGFGAGKNVEEDAAVIPETPTIQIPSSKIHKSSYEPNATASHWYRDDSYRKLEASKRSGAAGSK